MGSSGDGTGQHRAGTQSRFVLLCAPDREGEVRPPESLRNALAARDAEVVIRTSVYEAMADLIEHEQALLAHQRREALVLLLVEPDRVPHAARLVAAAAKYTPHTVCWRFAERDDPQLRSCSADDLRPAPEPATGEVTVRTGIAGSIAPRRRHIEPTPKLRLTEEPDLPDPIDDLETDDRAIEKADSEGGDEPQRPILSDEELEILLSDDWERQTGDGGTA